MATVGIWKICSSLGQVLKYTTNEEKTNIQNYKGLDDALKYIKDDFKTEKRLFVDGINCNSDNALKEMNYVKEKFMKVDKILGWHAYHSYKKGEITPEKAHEVGLQVAKEMWGDRFQVVVSTHVNGKCIHNHFVINSVSFVDGKKYYANRTTYAELRRLSNEICNENGLSTLKEKKTKSGINYLNYQNKSLTYTNYYKEAKRDLDFAITKAQTYQDFIQIMNNLGYEFLNRYGKLSIKGLEFKRNIRIERYFGEDYTIDNIKKQIKGMYLPVGKNIYKYSKPQEDIINKILKSKNNFYRLYIKYCRILNSSNYVKKYYVSESVKSDLNRLDELSDQIIFLVNNKVETKEQFISLLNTLESKLDNLKNSREDLWKKYKNESKENKQDIKENIDKITTEIKLVNNDLKKCESIKRRNEEVKENLEKIKESEMIKNELIK